MPAPFETERLRLRAWVDADLPAFAAMNADPAVMEHLPRVLAREESDGLAGRIRRHLAERGFGLWAVEVRKRGGSLQKTDPRNHRFLSDSAWSGRLDSNQRPLDPQAWDDVATDTEEHGKGCGLNVQCAPGDPSDTRAATTLPLRAAPPLVGDGVAEAALRAAIDRLTRALATADDETIAELVAERRSLREELRELLQVDAGVVRLDGARVRRRDP